MPVHSGVNELNGLTGIICSLAPRPSPTCFVTCSMEKQGEPGKLYH